MKLLLSLIALVFAAWLITKGANLILEEFNLGAIIYWLHGTRYWN